MGRVRDICHGTNGWTRGGWYASSGGTSMVGSVSKWWEPVGGNDWPRGFEACGLMVSYSQTYSDAFSAQIQANCCTCSLLQQSRSVKFFQTKQISSSMFKAKCWRRVRYPPLLPGVRRSSHNSNWPRFTTYQKHAILNSKLNNVEFLLLHHEAQIRPSG